MQDITQYYIEVSNLTSLKVRHFSLMNVPFLCRFDSLVPSHKLQRPQRYRIQHLVRARHPSQPIRASHVPAPPQFHVSLFPLLSIAAST